MCFCLRRFVVKLSFSLYRTAGLFGVLFMCFGCPFSVYCDHSAVLQLLALAFHTNEIL